jgi:hypothetical protein
VLQLARDADPMSMIRLAKMYLNGQGCQRNIALAQEWVRKARWGRWLLCVGVDQARMRGTQHCLCS